MREIKFKARKWNNKEWLYGYYLVIDGGHYILNKDTGKELTIIPETLGEYTGLLDKNNVEIYEGDIVKLLDYKNINREVIFISGCFDVLNFQFNNNNCEIIGNIYENKGLLK